MEHRHFLSVAAVLLLGLSASAGGIPAPAQEARLVFPAPDPAARQALHVRMFPLRQTAPRPFVYSVEARGEGLDAKAEPSHRTFGIELRIDYADGTRKWLMPKARLSPAESGWQTLTDVFVPPRSVTNVVFYCRLAQRGAARFRAVSIDELPPDVRHGPCSVREADGFLVLANDFVRLRLDPANGGTGVSLVDLRSGVDYASEDQNFRLFMDRFRSGGKSWKRAYAATVVKDTPEEAAVSLKLTAPDGFPYVEIEKVVRLTRDASAVDVAFRYRNLPESMGEQVLEPWFKNSFVPRGAKEQFLFLPTASGVRTWGGSAGDLWPTNALGGWMAAGDGQGRLLAAEFDPAYFSDAYLWLGGRDQYTAEWCFQPVALAAGATFETHAFFYSPAGLVRPDWCENGIAAAFDAAEKALAVRLFSARGVIATAELETTGRDGERRILRRILKLSPDGGVDWPTEIPAARLSHVRLRLFSDGKEVFEAERAFGPGFVYRSRKPKAKPAELKPFKLSVSDEVKSPATALGRPYAGGRLRVLFIVEIRQQREIVELMERMDVEPRTIRIGSNKNAGAWGMIEGFGTYSYSDANLSLKHELAETVDAIVVSGPLWEHLDRGNRAAILAKSRAGTGLVVIDNASVVPADFAPDAAGDAYVTGAVPRELLPFGADRLTARSSGVSRAVVCDFRAFGGLTPFVGHSQVEPPFRYQDYSLGVLSRALVWTAHRDLKRTADLRRTEEWIEPEPGLKIAHVRYLSPTGVVDWACEVRSEKQPATMTSLRLASDETVAGGVVTGRVSVTGGTVTAFLADGFGRILSTAEATDGTFRLAVPEARTSALTVTAELRLGSRLCARRRATVVCRRTPDPDEFAFAVGEESVSAHAKRYLDPLRFSRYRALGVNQLRFWRVEQEAVLRAFAAEGLGFDFPVGSLRIGSRVFPKEFAEPYARTKDRRYLCRKPCLHDRSWWTNLVRTVTQRIDATAKYSPVSYDCGDENSLTLWATPFDFCFSEPTLAAFREWLRGQYDGLRALNDAWGTEFPDWASVVPDTTEEARARAKRTGRRAYGAWADHRRFMELSFADFYRRLKDVMAERAPGVPFDMSGTQQPTGWTGMDMWLIGQIIDIPAAYDHAELAEVVRSFGHPLVKPWYGYGHTGASQRYRIWHDAFRFRSFGVSFYSGNSILMPDYTTPRPVADIIDALADLRAGGARLLASLESEEDVLVHYSQASIHAAQIEERYPEFVATRERLVKRLNAADLAYRFVAYAELEDGVLDRTRAGTVVLPKSFALSDAECAALRRFAERGGKVVGSADCGLFDEHCKMRTKSPIADILSSEFDFGPDPRDGVRMFRLKSADAGRTGRYYGFVRGLDAQGECVRKIRLDSPASVYDLRKKRLLGRVSEFPVRIAPGEAAFFAALPYEVRSLAVDAPPAAAAGDEVRLSFRIGATSAVSAPHPVSVAVYRPDGTEEPLYGGVADARDGRGSHVFRFALNDRTGDWRIILADFVSGKSAAAVVRLNPASKGL